MAQERRSQRRELDAAHTPYRLIIWITSTGRLEWLVPEASAEISAAKEEQAAAQAPRGAEVITAEEERLIRANHAGRSGEVRASSRLSRPTPGYLKTLDVLAADSAACATNVTSATGVGRRNRGPTRSPPQPWSAARARPTSAANKPQPYPLTEFDHQLHAFYPRSSRTDFEFDLRRYRR
jgi:hypothetical protein